MVDKGIEGSIIFNRMLQKYDELIWLREKWRLVTDFGVVLPLVLLSNLFLCLSVADVTTHSVAHQ